MKDILIQCIILNFNSARNTIRCLESLQNHRGPDQSIPIQLDTMIIDNGSTDGSAAWIRTHRPGCNLIELKENLGYSAGCNFGIKSSLGKNPDYYFFLNNDALVKPDTLSLLIETGQNRKEIGVLGPLLLTALPGIIIESFGINCTWKTGRFFHSHFGQPLEKLSPDLLARPFLEVDALSGCALLVKREVVEKIGGFDEEFFFYFEDADLCRRAQKAGFQTVLVPKAMVIHKGSSTISEIDPTLRIYYGARNQLLLFNRNEPYINPISRFARDLNIIGLNLIFTIFRSKSPQSGAVPMLFKGIIDYYYKRFGKYHGSSSTCQ